MNLRRTFFTLLAGFFLMSVVPQVFGQDDVIKERKKLMRSNNKQTKAIKKAAAAKDFGAVEASAKLVVANMDKLLDLFPKGSTSKKSRAKAEIWDKWDEFTQNRDKLKQVAQALAKAAAAKDETEVSLQAKNFGGRWSGSCGNCHKTFYKRKKRTKKK